MKEFFEPAEKPEKKKEEEKISRRDFLRKASKWGVAAVGATAAAGLVREFTKDKKPIEIDEMHGDKLVEEARNRAEKKDIENRTVRKYNEANEFELYADYESWLDDHREESEEKKEEARKYFNENK